MKSSWKSRRPYIPWHHNPVSSSLIHLASSGGKNKYFRQETNSRERRGLRVKMGGGRRRELLFWWNGSAHSVYQNSPSAGFLYFSTPFDSPTCKVSCSKEQFINLQLILWLLFQDWHEIKSVLSAAGYKSYLPSLRSPPQLLINLGKVAFHQ